MLLGGIDNLGKVDVKRINAADFKAQIGAYDFTIEYFTGDGATTSFVASTADLPGTAGSPDYDRTWVSIDGVEQDGGGAGALLSLPRMEIPRR